MAGRSYFDSAFLRRLEGLHLLAKRLADRAPAGGRMSRALGDGLEFVDHRAYTPGDDVRFLDWRYFGRLEKLLVRLFHHHNETDVAILLDTSASMTAGGWEKFDCARRVAAALSYIAVGGGRRVIVQPFAETLGRSVLSARDRAKILPLLEFLDTLQPAGATALETCARTFLRQRRNIGTLFLISDLLDAENDLPRALDHWNPARRDVVVLHTFSRLDASGAPTGATQLQHAETDAFLRLNVTEALRQRHAAAWRDSCANLDHTCRCRQALFVSLPAEAPFEKLLLQTLRRAGVVRT
ncbi:MAG: DUF58 domain-containing protein [Phycisphaerae bacterium]|nr:DUF58 domain-containing protein [Phycisphaerae bacterium]